jgi:mono/diheme cytochrome c family protein/glucose/arabinose dehydrogenase
MLKNVLVVVVLSSIAFKQCAEVDQYRDEIYEKPLMNSDPEAPSLSPEESMATIYLPTGFNLELVASEPMIEEPIDIAWDGDGKMYVAEMLTYMQDVDGSNTNEPWSRISVLEDTDGDGKMDKNTVFIDSLLLPRVVLPLDDRVIVQETYSNHFWSYRDTDGDRVADEKIRIFENDKRFKGNLEHQSANLTWSIDNWMYLSKDAFRYRWEKDQLRIDTMLDAPQGQYGLTQDEVGRLFYSRAGGEVVALGFQQHPTYGLLEMEGRWPEDFEEPWPIIGTPDVQGGVKRLRPNKTLNKFTGVSGQEIFLGDKLPMYGDLFVPEPVGRLIRRAKVSNVDGQIVLTNPYDKTEFMASTDPNFRPVRAATGPDGTLYIVDMYRGIIQEGNWTREGSFLRPEVIRRKLDENIGKGRIYRVVHEGMKPTKNIPLLEKSSEELIPFLGHPNGWYRMTAQKLLVLREDASVTKSLKDILSLREVGIKKNGIKDKGIFRLHALWTLEGLKQLDKETLLQAFKDEDPRVRSAAIRISETYLKKGDVDYFNAMKALKEDPSVDVAIQLVLSSRSYKDKDASKELLETISTLYPDNEVIQASAINVPLEIEKVKKKIALFDTGTRSSVLRGYESYKGLCAACHGKEGQGIENLAPPLLGSPRVMGDDLKTPVRILLKGMTGPVDGTEYGVMVPMATYSDEWIADVISYVRIGLGEETRRSRHQHVKALREAHEERDSYWTIKELEAL